MQHRAGAHQQRVGIAHRIGRDVGRGQIDNVSLLLERTLDIRNAIFNYYLHNEGQKYKKIGTP